jgi:sugar phosphate isomerase/epimerase
VPNIGRRSFLSLVASAAVLRARALKTVGVQLYTVRRVLPKEPLETLRAIEQIGYQEVECTADNLGAMWDSLKKTSLRAVSVHVNEELFIRQQDKLPAAVQDAASHGFQYVVCPYVKPGDRGGPDVMRKLGDNLNKAGELCRQSSISLCYHSHAFEYQPAGDHRLLDVLMDSTDPKLVSLELDVMWAHVAGVDPVSVIKQYGSRIPLLHLKNVAAGVEPRFNENIPRTAFHDLSNGAVDFPAVLAAASHAGVKHYFVEQDETPGNPLDSLRASFQYLAGLNPPAA